VLGALLASLTVAKLLMLPPSPLVKGQISNVVMNSLQQYRHTDHLFHRIRCIPISATVKHRYTTTDDMMTSCPSS